ncbi:MAG: hypothetical protein U1F66_01300 [bacterium]
MALSLLASVSKDAPASLVRNPPPKAPALGSALLDRLWGDPEARRRLEAQLPPSAAQGLRSLETETDPQIFFHDLLNLSVDLERSGNLQAAQAIDQAVAAFLQDTPGRLAPLADRARHQAEARLGKGSFGARAESLGRRFAGEAMDPAALIAMGIAPHAFRWARLWTAGRLGASGLVARGLANGAGFLTETSAFTLAAKGVASLQNRPQDWTPHSFAKEWAAGALVLGSLKVTGLVTGRALEGYSRSTALSGFAMENGLHSYLVGGLSQAGLMLGVVLGHDLQELVGLRERQARGVRFAEDLATFFQLKVGTGLMNAVLGPGYHRSLLEQELAYEAWRRNEPKGGRPPRVLASIFEAYDQDEAPTLPHSRPAYDAPGSGRPLEPLKTPSVLMMATEEPESGAGKFQWKMEDLKRLGEFYASLNIMEAEAIDVAFRDKREMFLFCRLLQNMSFPDRETRSTAFSKIGHALKHSNARGDAGGYVNWLTRKAFENLLESQNLKQAHALVQFLLEGGPLREYERLVAGILPTERFAFIPPWGAAARRAQTPNYDRIQAMPLLSQDAKDVLFRWSYTQAKAKQAAPHFLPEEEFLDRIGQSLFHPGYGDHISKVLVAAHRSPLPFRRLQRLHGLLGKTDALTPTKFMELADPHYQMVGSRHPELPLPLFGRSKPSQFNGYLGAKAPLELLGELRNRQADLLDPKRAEARKADRAKRLEQLEARRAVLDPQSAAFWAYGFKLMGDPFSRQIVADLEAKKFDLEVLSHEDFKRRCLEMDEPEAVSYNAFFMHAGLTGGRPKMLVKAAPFDRFSYTTRNDPVFLAMSKIVHEYQHFLDIDPNEARTLPVVHMQEMRAHLREALWRAQYGDPGKLESFLRDGTSGLALHWRDKFESIYGFSLKQD